MAVSAALREYRVLNTNRLTETRCLDLTEVAKLADQTTTIITVPLTTRTLLDFPCPIIQYSLYLLP
jgi:hypothetical protein